METPVVQTDYLIYKGIWSYGENHERHIVEDYNRIKVFTQRLSDWIKEKTGKEIPVGMNVKLTVEERHELHELIKTGNFLGISGCAEPKDYNWYENFYHGVSYPLTDELEDYDLIYNEL